MSVAVDELRRQLNQLDLERTGSDAESSALLYADLKQMARRISNQFRHGETLRTTALLHEAWMRLTNTSADELKDRQEFMALAGTIMRHVAVDHIRKKSASKRGGDAVKVSYEDAWQRSVDGEPDDLIVGVDEAIAQLEQDAPKLAELIQLLFFVGLTQQEVADLKGVSERTIRRDWRKARALLYQLMNEA